MRMTSNISKVKTWVSRSLATHRSVKLLGAVPLGALMITVTGLQFAPNQVEESERTAHTVVLIPGAPAALAGFSPNQQVEILGELDDDGVDGSVSYSEGFAYEYDEELFDPNWMPQVLSPRPVLIPGAPGGPGRIQPQPAGNDSGRDG